jgi:hypothetical protein
MKTLSIRNPLCIAALLATLAPVAAMAQSGTVNVDQVYTIRSISGGGAHLMTRPDSKGQAYTVDVSSATQILASNRPIGLNRLQPGWQVEVRGSRGAAHHIKAEVIILKKG